MEQAAGTLSYLIHSIESASLWSHEWWYDTVLPWVEPLATVFAFVAAAVALYFASNAYRLESRREARWEQQQRTQQASLVAAWFTREPEMGVYLHNASPLPVFDVRVQFQSPVEWVGAYVPEAARAIYYAVPPITVPVLTPTQEPQLHAAHVSHLHVPREVLAKHPPGVHSTSFRDAAGLRWTRTASGELQEGSPQAASAYEVYE